MKKNKVNQFIKDPKKALWTLSLPIVVGMMVQTLYNVVDTAYIGRIGADAIAALTFSFPLFFILIAINSGMSAGVNSLISRFLGEKDKKSAENAALHGIIISIISAILVCIIGLIFLKPLFVIFGATENVINLGISYMSIILYGVIIMFPSFILNSIFAAQGDTRTPMEMQVIGLIANMILDPIFIYGLRMGVKGAAIATIISMTITLILFIYHLEKRSHLRIKWKYFNFSWNLIKKIFNVGMPATITLLLGSVALIATNKFMSHFGTEYVASFGICSRLESVVTMPIVGFSMAMLTLIGMFFGAKRFDLLKSISWYSIKICLSITIIGGILIFIFPNLFLRIFTDDATLLNLGAAFIRIDVFLFPLMGISLIISRIMQGMGFGMPGLIINLIRVVFVSIPLAILLVYVFDFGYLSVPFSWVIGALTAVIVAIIWLRKELEKVHVI